MEVEREREGEGGGGRGREGREGGGRERERSLIKTRNNITGFIYIKAMKKETEINYPYDGLCGCCEQINIC